MLVMFVDLSGYTALTDVHGDDQAMTVIEAFERAVRGVAARRQMHVLKGIGDAFLLTGDDATEVVVGAREVVEAMEEVDLAPAVRIGIHAGPVSVRAGDVFGGTVDIAARVASEAQAGQVLVTADVIELVEEPISSQTLSVGSRSLRNVSKPVELFDICHDRRSGKVVDPVCRMLVSPETAAATVLHDGEALYFCSTDCLSRFIEGTRTSSDG